VSSRPAALVTGASRGIGEAVARRLASAGYDLTLGARNDEPLHSLAEELRTREGATVEVVAVDMSDEERVDVLADRHRAAHGRIDVLVLNAGMGDIGPLATYPVRRLDRMFSINVRSAYLLLQNLLPELLLAGGSSPNGAKVIAVASTTGVVGEPLNSAYGATKAALISLCETLCTEHAEAGVTATAVCPGYVATAMTSGLPGVDPAAMLPVDDVAEAIVSLTRLTRRTVVPQLVLTRPGPHLWRA
jgi:short-subunit dehydrogenase